MEKTPAGKLCNKLSTSSKISDFIIGLEKFKLTSSEQLQIINHCPQSQVEIQLLVEESEERLSEADVDEILDLINVHLLEENESGENLSTQQAAETENNTK